MTSTLTEVWFGATLVAMTLVSYIPKPWYGILYIPERLEWRHVDPNYTYIEDDIRIRSVDCGALIDYTLS